MTWIKKLVFGPLSVVRSNWLAWLLPSGLMNAYVRYLVAKGRVSSAGSVVRARLCRGARSARTGGGDANPVVIVGPPRVGKSILASRLAARLGFEIVGTDKLRFIYRDMGDAPTRLEFKRRF